MKNDKVYFPGLNGLRFFAALGVVIQHIEVAKYNQELTNIWETSRFEKICQAIHNAGPLGVSLFFVLSGFLITYLLLTESERTKTIKIKDFYVRRILRIWPLYYLVLGACFFILSYILGTVPSRKGVFLSIFMLPNVAYALSLSMTGFGPAWSVGVEEQFYLVWPWIVKYSRKNLPVVMAGLIAGDLAWHHYLHSWFTNADILASLFHFKEMAAGGLAAYLLFQQYDLSWIYSKWFQWLTFIMCAALIFNKRQFPVSVYYVWLAVTFCSLILNVASNPRPILKLENPILNYLGKISFGIYMWHSAIIMVAVNILTNNLLIYSYSIALTIGIAALSYEVYESPFLKLKTRFTKVLSGDDLCLEGEIRKD